MQEAVAAEAVLRVNAMQGKEEMWVLEHAIAAIKEGDAEEAVKLLSERLKKAKLLRRKGIMELSNDEPDWSSDDEAPPKPPRDSACAAVDEGDAEEMSQEPYWEELLGLEGGALAGPFEPLPLANEADVDSIRGMLSTGGFLESRKSLLDADTASDMIRGMHKLKEAGWPAAFIWASRKPWESVLALWPLAEELLGGEVFLEPSFTAYHLDGKKQGQGGKYVGANFGKPHRDYTFSDSYDAEGRPSIITMWIPCTPATTTNGCMYVVPREFDSFFERDDSHRHQQVINSGAFSGHKCVNFPIEGVRPLPGPAGSLFGWYGNVIHWGAAVHATADEPRASIAWVFRKASSMKDPECVPLGREEVKGLDLERRLELIVSSLKTFSHWYTIPKPLKKRLKKMMKGKKTAAVRTYTGLDEHNPH